MNGIFKFVNPIGRVASKVGGTFGKILDPAAAIANKAGGQQTTAGILLDPLNAIRRRGKNALILEEKPAAGSTLLTSGQQGSGLLTG